MGTPDGSTLYVADIGARKTYQYEIQPDGSLSNRRLFCEQGSDGMTLIKHISVPEPWTANVCFGGPERQTLFITASKGLYSIRLQVKGTAQGK
jgi:gluconolactonase